MANRNVSLTLEEIKRLMVMVNSCYKNISARSIRGTQVMLHKKQRLMQKLERAKNALDDDR